jgi:hypothetical protein
MYNNNYNTVEYAYNSKKNRHHFHNATDQNTYKSTDKDVIKSVYLHSSEITDYFNKNKNLQGYAGAVWADSLILDIDNDQDLNVSLGTTRNFIRYLESTYEVDPSWLQYKFSGSKGFHIRIPGELFGGFIPSVELPEKQKSIVKTLTEGFEGFDTTIYGPTRLIRVDNTINAKSDLYAIPLTSSELFSLSIDQIKELAKAPREVGYIDPDELEGSAYLIELKENAVTIPKKEKKHQKKDLEELWGPQSEGGRHSGAGSIVGYLLNYNVPKSSIKKVVKLWNQTNKPPKTDDDIEKDINSFLNAYGREEGDFWVLEKLENGKWDIGINHYDYIKFLEGKGFAKKYLDNDYVFIRSENNVVDQLQLEKIKDFILDYIREYYQGSPTYERELLNKLYSKSGYYFGEKLIECIPSIELDVIRDKKDEANYYFKNGFVRVDKNNGISLHNYSELGGRIWKSQIIQREFNLVNDEQKSVYEQFLLNVASKSPERLKTIKSSIGYLLHGYKDSSNAKVIVLVDQKIPDDGEPNGRTGKSIFGKALSKLKKSSRIDGKNFTFTERFTFQQVYLDTKIIEFNDVTRKFDFERLFSVTTDDMTIENKGEKPFTLKFDDSPKLLVSTNYTIKGQGASFEDRLFEVEFSDYYNENHKPIDDFKKLFFDEWDADEWNRFDNFLLECVELYLREGLVGYQQINLEKRKLMEQTSDEFINFADKNIVVDQEYDKSILFNIFRLSYNNVGWVKQKRFTGWIKLYAKSKGCNYRTRESNGISYFKLEDLKGGKVVDKPNTLFD